MSRPVQKAYDSFEKANIESAKHKSIIDRGFEKSISVEIQSVSFIKIKTFININFSII
jgi:hypothetical protein